MEGIADRIRELLTRTGWSQRELSRNAQLSETAIGWILRHPDHSVTLETAAKIADACKVSRAWVATGRGSPDDTEDAQQHPPDEVDTAGQRPVAHAAALTSRPLLRNLDGWPELEAGARTIAAERNRLVPEWAWTAMADSAPSLNAMPTPADIFALACFYVDHGWGKPREPRSETGPQEARGGGKRSNE